MNRDAMIRFVRAWRISHAADKKFLEMGFVEGPFFDISGNIADAIYAMLGENTDLFEKSFTYKVLTDESLSLDQCADKILARCNDLDAWSSGSTRISDCILESLREESARMKIGIGALIQTILGEWALRNEMVRH